MQLLETRRSDRRKPRWIKIAALILLAAILLGGWKAWENGRPRYLLWKQEKALQQARDFIAKRDAPNAQLALEVALKTVPGNPETLRLAAEMLEQVGSPQAMRLRRAVVQAVPHSAEDAAKLVLSCLRFRDFNAAKDALSATSPELSRQQPMIQAALAFAVQTDNRPVADLLFAELRAAIPSNDSLKHAHALLRLRHPNRERREEAKAELEEIAARNPTVAVQIHRELAADALLRNDYDELKRRQALILADPRANFTDQLQKANVDLLVNQQPFETLFPQLAQQATGNESDAVQFVQWLLVQNQAAKAAEWLEQLPAEIRALPNVKSVEADTVAQLENWDRLAELLAGGAWGPITPATLRLALAANTIDSPNRPSLRREAWDMTVESAGGNLGSLRVLQRLASLWKWTDEYERTLWIIARGFPDQTWAHQSLFNLYKDKKDARSMREVLGLLRSADATVPRYQHDWALLSMIIEPTFNWNAAKDSAARLHELYPDNATYATSHAFALAQTGKGAEAFAVVEKLSEADRRYLPRLPYLAFIYGVAKKSPEMESAITLAEGVPYLAEESYLFTRAREELERKPSKPATPTATPEPDSPKA